MSLGNVVDKFLNQHSLADTGTTEKTDFTTTGIRSEEVDDLDTGFENLCGGRLVDERRRVSVNGAELDALDRTTLVNRFTNDVHDATEGGGANGDKDGSTGVDNFLPTNETLGTVHSNSPDRVLTQMRGDFENETATAEILNLQGVKNGWEIVGLELDVDDGTNDGLD